MPRLIHSLALRILGIRVELRGNPSFDQGAVWVGNHLSYLDIPILGSLGPMRFVAKQEVAGWPLFGWLANLQRTVYISRRPRQAVAAAAGFAEAVRAGGVVVLFPEGTSSDGSAVLPFRPSLLEVLMAPAGFGSPVQGFTLRLLEVDGRDVNETWLRDLYAYHREMTLLPHLRAFLRLRGARLQVIFHQSLIPSDFADRRRLAMRLHEQVAWGLTNGVPAP
ncbi:lysophospholipid acyltransferase family protein [Thermomonas sp.]|uniref:lysophospholipid acyltransferase family protein n=1 Tax=Thermomonas sp. TaxID=1971895 RepID=UPI00248A5FB9|nr:lysophospholipid acyltransferase family protein [Thermomonas sp.]MDI1253634.1 lysophospholipid acyltransferase family protein [Thermomonas sp.]